jgi:hypothetical protein
MMKNMSDEDLKRNLDAARSFMPGISNNNSNFYLGMPNLSPEMMRMASERMNSMTPEQIQNMGKVNIQALILIFTIDIQP